MTDKIDSSSDARVNNNPPQRPKLASDPMRLQYRVLSDAEKKSMGDIKLAYEDLYRQVIAMGTSREISVALTQLEDSCMWAIKHLTRPA